MHNTFCAGWAFWFRKLQKMGRKPGEENLFKYSTKWLNIYFACLKMGGMSSATAEIQLDLIFAALANRTRRRIMKMVSAQARTVCEIAEEFKMSLNGISKHLKVLEKARLLSRKKTGRIHLCQVNPQPLAAAQEFIGFYEKFWNEKLDHLENFIQKKGMEP